MASVSVFSAHAQNSSWAVTGGGLFNDGNNWSTMAVPTGIGTFNNEASGIITFSPGTTTLSSLRFANDYGASPTVPGKLTLDLTDAFLDLTATGTSFQVGATVNDENDIVIHGGTAKVQDVRLGYIANAADNTLTIQGGAEVIGLPSGATTVVIFRVGGAGATNNKVIVTGEDTTVTASGTSSAHNWYIGASGTAAAGTSGIGNVISIRDGAVAKMKSWVYLGHTGNSDADAPNLLEIDGGEMRVYDGVARPTYIRDGLIRIKNGGVFETTQIIANESGANASIEFSSGTLLARNVDLSLVGGAPLIVGDGGAVPAEVVITRNGGSNPANWNVANGVQFASNAIFSGVGTLNSTVTTSSGMKVRPNQLFSLSTVSGAQDIGTLNVNSDWNNTGIEIELHVGNFPEQLAATTGPDPFNPPVDKFTVSGQFTLGGNVVIDLEHYAQPEDQDYDLRVIGWGTATGDPNTVPISFVNGSPIPYEWRTDGLYLQIPIAGSKWAFDGSGDWTDAAKWTGGVPNASGAIANLGTIITNAATITLDAGITVGSVNLTSPISYTVEGVNSLTLDVDTGSAGLKVTAGSHAITSPISLLDDAVVDVAAGATLSMTGGINGTTAISKTGDGQLTAGKIDVATLSVAAGTLQLQSNGTASGVAEVDALNVAGSGKLDLRDNGVVIDYTDPNDPTNSIRSSLSSGRNGGTWDGAGIMSSTAGTNGLAIGYARASELLSSTVFGSINLDADAIVIRTTYEGDSNLDGKVNTVDFNYFAGGFGSANPDWIDGDYDYDGDVDSIDFNAFTGNYGKALPNAAPALGAVVPEPALLGLTAFAPLALRRRRA